MNKPITVRARPDLLHICAVNQPDHSTVDFFVMEVDQQDKAAFQADFTANVHMYGWYSRLQPWSAACLPAAVDGVQPKACLNCTHVLFAGTTQNYVAVA
jgi:hypothetical protein